LALLAVMGEAKIWIWAATWGAWIRLRSWTRGLCSFCPSRWISRN